MLKRLQELLQGESTYRENKRRSDEEIEKYYAEERAKLEEGRKKNAK